MTKRSKKIEKPQATKIKELTVATSAQDLEQANEYKTLLETNHIHAVIKEQTDSEEDQTTSILIMVPEESIDEAHVIIESQNAYEDFYDLASEEENDYDLDNGFFDDEF